MSNQQGKALPLTYIEWVDSCSFIGSGGVWKNITDVKQLTPSTIKSIGWIAKETKEYVVLLPHVSDECHSAGDICVPKVAITYRVQLVQPKSKPKKKS